MARKRAPEKKEWIRKAAIRIIAREGFYHCTTDKIAGEAGVSVGTIYNYFNNKKEILSYIFKVERTKLDVFFSRLKKKDLAVPQKIKFLIDKYFKYTFRNQEIARLLHDESNKSENEITREIFNYILSVREHLRELLEEGVEEGSVPCNYNPDMMINVITGAATVTAFYGFIQEENIEYIYNKGSDELFDIFTNGIFTSPEVIRKDD